MFQLTFEVEGVQLLNRSFDRVNQRIDDLTPIWDAAQKEFWKLEEENFKSENARGASGTWKPLTRAYAKRKAQRWGVKTILRASDRMFLSLTSQTDDTLLFKEPHEMGIGTSVEYARYHQKGGKKTLPKRPGIDFGETQKTQLSKSIQRDLLTAIRRDLRGSSLEVTE